MGLSSRVIYLGRCYCVVSLRKMCFSYMVWRSQCDVVTLVIYRCCLYRCYISPYYRVTRLTEWYGYHCLVSEINVVYVDKRWCLTFNYTTSRSIYLPTRTDISVIWQNYNDEAHFLTGLMRLSFNLNHLWLLDILCGQDMIFIPVQVVTVSLSWLALESNVHPLNGGGKITMDAMTSKVTHIISYI